MAGRLDGVGELHGWADVPAKFKHRHAALLIGNGMSRSVWDGFDYPSLYDMACTVPNRPLTSDSQKLFQYLQGSNFEQVLGLLIGSKAVVEGLGIEDRGEIEACRANVRDALIEAVRTTHIPWAETLVPNLVAIGAEMATYNIIFTTNYDLLPYWALMQGGGEQTFKDFFVNGEFVKFHSGNRIPVYYVHGALHLYSTREHRTRKRANSDGKNLLEQFGESFIDGNRPLFVSEGHWREKLLSIHDSDYLTFVFEALRGYTEGRIVVFGHGLDPNIDQHLIDALHPTRKREAAISIYPPGTPEKLAKIQTDLLDRLPEWDIDFFDMTTHPLGVPARKVEPPPLVREAGHA